MSQSVQVVYETMSLGSQRVGQNWATFTCILYIIVKSVSFLVKTVEWFPMKFGVNPYSTSWPTRTLKISLFHTSPIYGHGQSLSYLISPSHCYCHLIKILKLFFLSFQVFLLSLPLSGSFPFSLYIRQVWWLYARCADLEFLLVCSSGLALNTRYILHEIWKVEVKQQSHF